MTAPASALPALPAPSSGYYDDQCAQYASACWVHEVADAVARSLHRFRPFTRDDILVDYGCGPGVTLEKILYLNSDLQPDRPTPAAASHSDSDHCAVPSTSQAALLGQHARICDLSSQAVHRSRQLASIRCPLQGVWCDRMTAFDSPTSDRLTPQFLAWLPAHIDVAYSSLVAEYLSFDQLAALSKALLERLQDDGVLAWFDWAEHAPYEPQHSDGIHQPAGLNKTQWLRLAALLADYVEQSEARLLAATSTASGQRTEGQQGPFLPLPDWRLTIAIGSFDVKHAAEQTVPSSDVVHYLLLKKSVTAANHTFKKLVVPRP